MNTLIMKLNCLIIAFLILNISLVLSLDSDTPLVCGGDNETIIACLGDEELTFLGYFPEEVGVGGGTPETPKPPKVLEPFLLFGFLDISFLRRYGLGSEDLLLIYIILAAFILCLFLWLRKRKCDECKKRFKYKELTKYEEKYYCKECLEEIKSYN